MDYNSTLILIKDGQAIGACLARAESGLIIGTNALDCVYTGMGKYHIWFVTQTLRIARKADILGWIKGTDAYTDYLENGLDPATAKIYTIWQKGVNHETP